ncbi:hypothetical protein N8342_04070 [Acidimicrobiales bacterium]|nr:hypothetical protein [Acidimicrobiales bacterium]
MTNNPITNKSLRINTKSVRFRTTAGAAVALIGLLAVAGFGVNWFVGRQIQRSFDQTLFEQAADRAALIDGGASPDTLMTPVGDEDFVVAIGPDGERLASAGVMVPGDLRTEVPLGMSDLLVTVIGSGHNAEQEIFGWQRSKRQTVCGSSWATRERTPEVARLLCETYCWPSCHLRRLLARVLHGS